MSVGARLQGAGASNVLLSRTRRRGGGWDSGFRAHEGARDSNQMNPVGRLEFEGQQLENAAFCGQDEHRPVRAATILHGAEIVAAVVVMDRHAGLLKLDDAVADQDAAPAGQRGQLCEDVSPAGRTSRGLPAAEQPIARRRQRRLFLENGPLPFSCRDLLKHRSRASVRVFFVLLIFLVAAPANPLIVVLEHSLRARNRVRLRRLRRSLELKRREAGRDGNSRIECPSSRYRHNFGCHSFGAVRLDAASSC